MATLPVSGTDVQRMISPDFRQSEMQRNNTNGLVERVTAAIVQRKETLFASESGNKANLKNVSMSQPVPAEKCAINNSCPEVALKEYVCTDVDIHVGGRFGYFFLTPNEIFPENVASHLKSMPQGVILSVGTERCFFDLLFADPAKCEGMVVRDVNSRVKAYVDFNVLLLRIAASRQEYCSLAKKPENEEAFKVRLAAIRAMIGASDDIPSFLKAYYQKYLEDFASVYYRTEKDWAYESEGFYSKVNYYKNDALFAKLQLYAKAGRIVSTIGDINDLSPFCTQKIGAIDASNVGEYCFLVYIHI
jgi:hypothetical protein